MNLFKVAGSAACQVAGPGELGAFGCAMGRGALGGAREVVARTRYKTQLPAAESSARPLFCGAVTARSGAAVRPGLISAGRSELGFGPGCSERWHWSWGAGTPGVGVIPFMFPSGAAIFNECLAMRQSECLLPILCLLWVGLPSCKIQGFTSNPKVYVLVAVS